MGLGYYSVPNIARHDVFDLITDHVRGHLLSNPNNHKYHGSVRLHASYSKRAIVSACFTARSDPRESNGIDAFDIVTALTRNITGTYDGHNEQFLEFGI